MKKSLILTLGAILLTIVYVSHTPDTSKMTTQSATPEQKAATNPWQVFDRSLPAPITSDSLRAQRLQEKASLRPENDGRRGGARLRNVIRTRNREHQEETVPTFVFMKQNEDKPLRWLPKTDEMIKEEWRIAEKSDREAYIARRDADIAAQKELAASQWEQWSQALMEHLRIVQSKTYGWPKTKEFLSQIYTRLDKYEYSMQQDVLIKVLEVIVRTGRTKLSKAWVSYTAVVLDVIDALHTLWVSVELTDTYEWPEWDDYE